MQTISGRQFGQLLGDWRASTDSGAGYVRLAAATRLLILDGRLPLHVRLPSQRDLADALNVSRTTVTAAYDSLRDIGYAASRQGSGTWTTLPDDRSMDDDNAPWAPFAPAHDGLINLSQASPPAPVQALRAAHDAALAQLPRYTVGSGYFLRGIPVAREAIANRFSERGLPTSPDQILVTAGAQHAFSLILSLTISAGDRVMVEHPTYPNTLDAARLARARLVPVAMREDGWDVDAFGATLRQTSPRLAVVVPDFHNPTGLLAGMAEREHLADHVARTRTLTVVDESLVELGIDRAAGEMPAPFATFAPDDLTLTIGSLNKCVWGGLRVGWIRGDQSMIRRLAAIRATNDLSSAALEQLAVTDLMPRLDDVMEARRAELRAQRDAVLSAIDRLLPSWRVRSPAGGLVLWAHVGAAVSSALVGVAERHGVSLASGTRFGVDGAFEQRLRLPYTGSVEVLQDAVARIATAYRLVTERSPDLTRHVT